MTRIYFVRHAQSLHPWKDDRTRPLKEEGHRDTSSVLAYLKDTLELLVKETKKQGVSQISLEATDMGRPLYEKFEFVKMENEMEYNIGI